MIKGILDEIAALSGKNDKRKLLSTHADNELLKEVIYKANSRRVKFGIKRIPQYEPNGEDRGVKWALDELSRLETKELTGGNAIKHLQMVLSSINEGDQDVIKRVIGKDLKIGMDTGINKAIPNLIEETPYMGAKSFSEKGAKKLFDSKGYVISQVKEDGTYRNMFIKDGEVESISRQGEVSFLDNAKFMRDLETLGDYVLNGELTIDGKTRYEANGMINSIMDINKKAAERGKFQTDIKIMEFEEKHGSFRSALDNMRYTVWDIITTEEYFNKKSKVPYHERLKTLEGIISGFGEDSMVSLVETVVVETYQDAINHFLDTQDRGLEGTILKSSEGGWKNGKPTYQLKMKVEMFIDLRIVEGLYGNVGTKNEHLISRFKVESSCGLLTAQPSGMTEEEMEKVTKNVQDYIGSVVQVKCSGLSQNEKGEWSLLHPSIDEFRGDKDECDSLESAKEIEEMAKNLNNK